MLSGQGATGTSNVPFGEKDFASALEQIRMEWLQDSASTYENVTLSAYMLKLAFQGGIGFHIDAQDIKRKYAELLREYTEAEKLTAIRQLFAVLQVATLSATHQFP